MFRIARFTLLASLLAAPLGCSMCSDCADNGPSAVRNHAGYQTSYESDMAETSVTVEAEPDEL